MSDQQRYDSLGCGGANWVRTPNLDRLASEGVLFEHCYVNNPVCTPSRASMLTGRHLPGHGVYRLHDALPDTMRTVPELLRESGYQTALFGKLHTSGRIFEAARRHPHDGFEIYEWCLEASISMDSPFNGYSRWLAERDPAFRDRLAREGRKLLHLPREYHFTRWAAERTIAFLRERNRERPFFCMMSVFDPHNPYDDYPPESAAGVDRVNIPDPVPPISGGPEPYGIRMEREHSYLGAFRNFGPEDIREMRFGYAASIGFLDEEVGRVLETLDETDDRENTLVVFVSDHGDMLGDHGLLVKGAFFYDPCTRVPLIIRWPGRIPVGKRLSALVQPHDLAATFLAAAGIDPGTASMEEMEEDDETGDPTRRGVPESLDLLLPEVIELDRGHDSVYCLYRNSGISDTGRYWNPAIHAAMMRSGPYKLNVYQPVPQADEPFSGQLFDLDRDPLEQTDLWRNPSSADIRQRMIEEYLAWMTDQEIRYLGSRGGGRPPSPNQQIVNALKQ